jgi:hypothetical protein
MQTIRVKFHELKARVGRTRRGFASQASLQELAEFAILLEEESDPWSRRVILEEVAKHFANLRQLAQSDFSGSNQAAQRIETKNESEEDREEEGDRYHEKIFSEGSLRRVS